MYKSAIIRMTQFHNAQCRMFVPSFVYQGQPFASMGTAGGAARKPALQHPTQTVVSNSPCLIRQCPANQEMCRFGNSLKCVDTLTNLVSCGGCMNTKLSQRGQDCSEMPGVDVVSCHVGVCIVESCIKGYTFNPEHRSCSLNR